MHNFNKSDRKIKFTFNSLTIMMLCVAVTLSGCAPLKKKFVRAKKKEEKEKFIPVLEPIDYAARTQSAEEIYRSHYSLWKIWEKEALNATLESKDLVSSKNDKKVISAIAQMIEQMKEMRKLLIEEKQPPLDSLIAKLLDVQQTIESKQVYSTPQLDRQIKRISKEFRSKYSPQALQGTYVE